MRVAVVGSGVSGLLVAHLLSDEHEVVVFEQDDRIGGHTHTVAVTRDGVEQQVDTGFIVFNDWTYPNFIALLDHLGVSWQPSDMSFSVKCLRTGLEYNGTSIDTLFAQRRNLLRPTFWRMIRDILRFNRSAPGLLQDPDPSLTIGTYVDREGYSREFVEHYLMPMGAAIWSSGSGTIRDFPAVFFVRFLHNHGMLSVENRPTWRVVRGGSRSYLGPLTARFRDRIRVNAPVERVLRQASGVSVTVRGHEAEHFDQVVLATHSDQALRMLADASPVERDVLGAMPYQTNRAVLHTDRSVMPKAPRAWASWNYLIPEGEHERLTVTYWMNLLQSLRRETDYFVTLNPVEPIAEHAVLREMDYEHPQYTAETVRAQARYDEIGGVNRTHFCGAYWFNGFHEDGVVSALRVARAFGKSL